MNIEKEREAFSRWVLTHPDNLDLTAYEENIMFDAWLASASREGYKLVPVDSLKEIISCAYCHIHDRCIGNEGDDVINHILAMGVEDED